MTTQKISTWTGAPLIGDSFTNMLAGLGVYGRDKVRSQVPIARFLAANELVDLYRADWLSRKIVEIPAFDSTRAWRHWNADKDDTKKLEDIERQFGLQRKCMEAFVKARLFGGAAIVLGVKGAGDWNEELDLDKVTKGSLKFIHVVTGGRLPMITAGPLTRDITSPWFGEPNYYERSNTPIMPAPGGVALPPSINVGGGNNQYAMTIHPSRVVRLTGLDYPDMESAPDPWGDSVLQPVWDAIRDAGLVGQSVANLASRANVNVISVPGLTQKLATDAGTQEVTQRFANANVAASVVNALLLDKDEEWNQLSVNFSQLPQVVQMFLLIGAAAADIPSTRLLSREPSGMNATGDSDTRNYYDRLSADQKVRITPLLSRLDEVLIRSSLGNRPPEIDYDWNPLWQLDDGQKADINLKNAQAFQIDNNAGLIDPIALKKGRENQLVEQGTYPGLEQAINDAEGADGEDVDEQALARLGLDPDTHAALPQPFPQLPPPGPNNRPNGAGGEPPPNPMPGSEMRDAEQSALGFLVPGGPRRKGRKAGAAGGASAPRPFAQARPLYVFRPLLDSASFRSWAKAQGFRGVVPDPHVTLLYSKEPVDATTIAPDSDAILVHDTAPRAIKRLGQNAVALCFQSHTLGDRHNEFVAAGGSHDYAGYQPHITISYQVPDGFELDAVTPYSGPLTFGPEQYRDISVGDDAGDFDESQHPRGEHGEFAPGGGGEGSAAKSFAKSVSGTPAAAHTGWSGKNFDPGVIAAMSPEARHAELSRRLEENASRNATRQAQTEKAQRSLRTKAGWVYRAQKFMGEPKSKAEVARASWEYVTKQAVGVAHHSAMHHLLMPVVEGAVIGGLAELGAPVIASAIAVEVAGYAVEHLIEHTWLSPEHAHGLLMKVCDGLVHAWSEDLPPSVSKPLGEGGFVAADADNYEDMLLAVLRLKAGLQALPDDDNNDIDPGEALSDTAGWTPEAREAAAAARAGQAHSQAQRFESARLSSQGKQSRHFGVAASSYATAVTAFKEAAQAEREGRHSDAQELREAGERNLAAAQHYVAKHGLDDRLVDAELAGSGRSDYIRGDAADPDEPRDEQGRWTAGGGGSQGPGGPDSARARPGGAADPGLSDPYRRESATGPARSGDVANVWRRSDISFDELRPAGAGRFHIAIDAAKASNPNGAAVTLHSPNDYSHMRLFTTPDRLAGFALDGGNIVSVFKNPTSKIKNFAGKALALATQNGGRQLDCFDTALPRIYSESGFRAVARLAFNDEYKPEGWDYDRFKDYNGGRPDVVFMVHDPAHAGTYKTGDGVRVATYEEGEAAQQRALAALKTSDADFDESKHPRVESGPGGGQFTSAGGTGAAPAKAKLDKVAVKGELKKFVDPGSDDGALDTVAEHLAAKDISADEFEKGMFAGLATNKPRFGRTYAPGHIGMSANISGGVLRRSIDFSDNTASHDYLALNPATTGTGTAKKLLSSQVALYEKLGLSAVKVHANINVGGYAWAKYGFVPSQHEWDSLRSTLESKVEGGSSVYASSWDEMSSDAQSDAERQFMRSGMDEELRYQEENWRENDALDDARESLVNDFHEWKNRGPSQGKPEDADLEWMTDALTAARELRAEAGKPAIPYTDAQLLNAMTLTTDRGYSGRNDDLDFDDKLLQEPSNLPPPEQLTLPGVPKADPAAQLKDDMRHEISDAMLESLDEKAKDVAENLDPPHWLSDAAEESLSDYWSSMDDDDRFRWVQRNTNLANEHDASEPELAIPDPTERGAIIKALQSDDPKSIWAIADSKYGKDLLLGTDWSGQLDLHDDESMTRFKDYVAKEKPAVAKAA